MTKKKGFFSADELAAGQAAHEKAEAARRSQKEAIGDQGVIRMNICVPRGLKCRMDAALAPVNWSALASRAFETELLQLASHKEAKSMDEVIARLKAAAQIEASAEYQTGQEAGERWAKQMATPKQLRRMAKWIADTEHDEVYWWEMDAFRQPFGATGFFALAILGLSDRDVDGLNATRDFWSDVLGAAVGRIEDADFFRGFGTGAAEVWKKVIDKI